VRASVGQLNLRPNGWLGFDPESSTIGADNLGFGAA